MDLLGGKQNGDVLNNAKLTLGKLLNHRGSFDTMIGEITSDSLVFSFERMNVT